METYLQLAIYGNPLKTGKYNMKTHLLSRETICVKVGGEPAANSISCNLVNMASIWLGPGFNIYVATWSIWNQYGVDQVASYMYVATMLQPY